MMTIDHRLPETATGREGRAALASFAAHVTEWLRTCADYYAASVAYEELSRLSDAELSRRGLCRDTLGREITDAVDRGDHR